MLRRNLLPAILLLLGGFPSTLSAQGMYDLAVRFAYVHTFDTNPLLLPNPSTGWTNADNFFGEAALAISGAHHHFNLEYAGGWQRNPDIVNRDTVVQQFNASYDQDLSPTVRLNLRDRASYSNDYTPGDVYSGVVGADPGAQDVPGLYIGRADQLRNQAEAEVIWRAEPKSEIRILYTNRLVHYGYTATGLVFNDSVDHALEAGYQYQFTSHLSAGVFYRFRYLDFSVYDNTLSHAALASMIWQIRPSVSLSAAAGPIYAGVPETGESTTFLNAEISLQKTYQQDRFSVSYSRDLADTDGVLGASQTDMVYATWARLLLRRLDWSVNAGFIRDKTIESGMISDQWFAATGLRYQVHDRFQIFAVYRWSRQTLDVEGDLITPRHQVVVGVRFIIPHLWRKQG
jgi:hypothetical protein